MAEQVRSLVLTSYKEGKVPVGACRLSDAGLSLLLAVPFSSLTHADRHAVAWAIDLLLTGEDVPSDGVIRPHGYCCAVLAAKEQEMHG